MGANFSWISSFSPQLLLKELREARTIADKRVSMEAWTSGFWTPILITAISASPKAHQLKAQCVRKVIFNADCKLNSPDQFLDDCEEALVKLLARPSEQYFVLSSLTYEGARLFERLAGNNCTLVWPPKGRTGKFRKAMRQRKKADHLVKQYGAEEPKGLTHVMIELKAATPREAAEQALQELDKFRGLVNLMANGAQGMRFRFGPGTPHAINRLRRGPYSTVHKANGELAADIIWYEPGWYHREKSISFKEKEKDLQKNIRKWWGKASGGPLKAHLETGLLRYCHALDDHNMGLSLLRLWSTLEMLTGTSKYDLTVNRIVRLFTDSEEARQVAEHVRRLRNAHVHMATDLDEWDLDAIMHHAELLCAKLLVFCLNEGRKFKTVGELYSFLDCDLDLASLKTKQRLVNRFIAYRGMIKAKMPRKPPKSNAAISVQSDS